MSVRILLAQPASRQSLPDGVLAPDASTLQDQVEGWLASNERVFCLPPGVTALIFDCETGQILGRLGS